MSESIPDYSGDTPALDSGAQMERLRALVLRMAELELKVDDLEFELKETKKELGSYKEKLVPELMSEIGLDSLRTQGGIEVEVKEEVRAAFPKDSSRQASAFAYLKETGNDGLIKREITIQYGRDSTEWAERLTTQLEEWGVGDHATVQQEWTIHHQTLLAFIRSQLKEGSEIPLDMFGAYVQKFAKIKRGGR